ncbi:hypothetical protein AYI70_g2033 [Smittium culicis]|uniref:Endonuclease/exonuclease/phosphatase domain-containing protein n=1 Tax=Smittium culicis TaxID=133412 RepID=A0A1R1Y9Z9_9FUNG|nr:hypothetical protein AYI70_g2033 [Smittium culicis]
MNVHLPSNSTRRKKASDEIFNYMTRAKNKFTKNIICGDFNMDTNAAKKIYSKNRSRAPTSKTYKLDWVKVE